MSATVGTLNVEVQLQLAKMQAQFDSLTTTVRQHTSQVSSEFSKMGGQIERVFDRAVEYASIYALGDFARSVVENAAEIQHAADAARMSAESFQVLQVVARDNGLQIEQLTRGFDSLQRQIGEATSGVKSAQRPFQELGLDWAKLAAMAPEQQFEAVARAVVNASDQEAAFAAATEILGGRAGPKLLKVMKELATQGFGGLSQAAKETGQVMSNEVVQKLDDLENASVRFFTRVRNSISTSIAEGAAEFGHSVTDIKLQIQEVQENIFRLEHHPLSFSLGESVSGYQKELVKLEAELAKAEAAQNKADEAYRAAQAAAEAALAARQTADAADVQHQHDLDDAMMQRIKDAAAGMKAVEEQRARELEAEAAEGVRMWEETRTPAEKYKNELAQINQLEREGFVSTDTAQRARKQALDDYQAGGADQLKKLQKDAEIAMAAPETPGGSNAAERARELTVEIDRLKKAIEELKAAEGDHSAAITAGETHLKQLQQEYDAQEKIVQAQKDAKKSADELGRSLSNTLVDGVEKGEKFHQILIGLLDDLVKMAIQGAIEKPLANLFSGAITGATGGGGGFLGALVGLLAGARASGGPVEAGKPYLVGEQGPEIVVPGSSGNVLPNGASMGGGSVTFNNNFGGGVTREDIIAMIPAMVEQQRGALADAARRGGPFAQVLGTA